MHSLTFKLVGLDTLRRYLSVTAAGLARLGQPPGQDSLAESLALL